MQIFNNKKLNNTLKYIMPSLATAIIFCAVLLIKGIYPFGAGTIDFYDLSDQGTPIYLHVYDAVHGHKNMFYDLYSALTTNMSGMLGTSGISPFNLYFLFIKRESVLKCMSIFILIKMMVMSFGMYLFLDRATKAGYLYELTFAVCYGFSGYVLLHYTSHIWFDNVAYFPFVMTGLYLLITEGKYMLYTVSMTLSIICGYYISFQFFIYIFLTVGLAVVISKLKGDGADYIGSGSDKCFHLIQLLLCTIVSICASAFIILPQFSQTLSSARFTNESGGGIIGMYTGILKQVIPAYTSRWFVILNISFAAAIISVGLIKYRKDKRLTVFTICMLIFVCSELLFENVNLFWHYGSYVHYPLRNGFMIGFTLSYLACVYIGKFGADKTQTGKLQGIGFICLSIIATVLGMFAYYKNPGMSLRSVFHMVAAIMAICFVVYVFLVVYKSGKYMKLSPVLVVCELIFYGFVFLGKPAYITGYTEEPEMERESVYICNQLYDAFDFGADDTYMNIMNRVKNPDESLNSNYALVLRRSALSNWTALISPKLQESAKRLGYTVQYTRLLDSGGTVFSDALLGIKNIITYIPQDENLYELIDTADIVVDKASGKTEKYYYYKCKYELPWGIRLDDINKIDFTEDDTVKLYNDIYVAICKNTAHTNAKQPHDASGNNMTNVIENQSACIASYIELSPVLFTEDGKALKQDIDVEGSKALYYFADQVDTDDYNTTIKVNGETIRVPSISEKDNTLYPAHFNNNALFLGTYDNETVNIDIVFKSTDKNGNEVESSFDPKIIAIDLNALKELCDSYKDYSVVTNIGKTSYELNVNSDENGYVMLPLSYDKGYKATVNGKEENIEFIGGLFMAVPVYEGQNNIIVKFTPPGQKTGVVISAIAIMLMITVDMAASASKKINVLLRKVYITAWTAVVFLMYILPILYAVILYVIVTPAVYLLFKKAAELK